MATQKTIYQTFKENPDAWIQAAIDAQEINEAEREAIEKFINAQSEREAAQQMDVIRAAMQRRPEFELSQEERNELGDMADDLKKHLDTLREDVSRMAARRVQLEGKQDKDPKELEELKTIEEQLKEKLPELEKETKLYSTYLLIGALSTSEQAQEQTNRWYEDVGREQGKSLLTALSEYSQVAVHAIIPGHKEQVQDHLQKAEAASGRYQASVARGFETQLRRMEPSRKERRADNKMTKKANKQIKQVQKAAKTLSAKEAKLIREAKKIATSEYRFRQRFNNIPGWQHGAPTDRTFQEITDAQDAQKFMESRNPQLAEQLSREVEEARTKLTAEKQTLNTVMSPMLAKLDQRQQALTEFVQDYQHALHNGYVGQQRADAIFERLGEATKYAIFTPEFVEKLQGAGIEFDPKYQTIGAQAPQQAEPARRPFANPVQEAYQQASEAAAKQPAHAPRAQNDIPRVTPSAITRWDDYIAQTEQQNQPKCLCYRDKKGPHAIALDADPKKRSERIERFKQDHGGEKARFSIKNESQALEYLEIEGLKFRGARGMDKEHAQEWRKFVDNAYTVPGCAPYKHQIEPAVAMVERIAQGATVQDILQNLNEIYNQTQSNDMDVAIAIASDQLNNPVMQEVRDIIENARAHNPTIVYPDMDQVEQILDQNGQNIGEGIEEQDEGYSFDPTGE